MYSYIVQNNAFCTWSRVRCVVRHARDGADGLLGLIPEGAPQAQDAVYRHRLCLSLRRQLHLHHSGSPLFLFRSHASFEQTVLLFRTARAFVLLGSINLRSIFARAGGHLLLADHRLVRVQHHSDSARTARVRGVRARVRRAAHQRERPRDVRPRARPLLEGLLARVHTARAPRVFRLFVSSAFTCFTVPDDSYMPGPRSSFIPSELSFVLYSRGNLNRLLKFIIFYPGYYRLNEYKHTICTLQFHEKNRMTICRSSKT